MNKFEFSAYTMGLIVNHVSFKGDNAAPRMVSIEISKGQDGARKLVAVSGHNLARIPGISSLLLSLDEWESLPYDAYAPVRDMAIFELMGFSID